MTSFTKAKSDDQTSIVKFRVAANIIEYHIISKFIFLKLKTAKKYNLGKFEINRTNLICLN